jgi:Tol biopolymer transport system component
MKLDGTADKRIDDGWAAQWSPNGKSIAYTNDNSIRLYDLETGRSRVVLAKGSHPYHYIYWNMSWSPDSRQLVFKGKLEGKQEIAIINVAGKPSLKRCFATSEEMGADFAWAPDGRRILFNMHSRKHLHPLIYQLDIESQDPPRVVPEAQTAMPWTNVCFSPDGKWMVLATPN